VAVIKKSIAPTLQIRIAGTQNHVESVLPHDIAAGNRLG